MPGDVRSLILVQSITFFTIFSLFFFFLNSKQETTFSFGCAVSETDRNCLAVSENGRDWFTRLFPFASVDADFRTYFPGRTFWMLFRKLTSNKILFKSLQLFCRSLYVHHPCWSQLTTSGVTDGGQGGGETPRSQAEYKNWTLLSLHIDV